MHRRPNSRIKRRNYLEECLNSKSHKNKKRHSKLSGLMREGYMDDMWSGNSGKSRYDAYDDDFDDDFDDDLEDNETRGKRRHGSRYDSYDDDDIYDRNPDDAYGSDGENEFTTRNIFTVDATGRRQGVDAGALNDEPHIKQQPKSKTKSKPKKKPSKLDAEPDGKRKLNTNIPTITTRLKDIYNKDSKAKTASRQNAVYSYLCLFNDLIKYPQLSGISNPKIKNIANLSIDSKDFRDHALMVKKYIRAWFDRYLEEMSKEIRKYMRTEISRSGTAIRQFRSTSELSQKYRDDTFDSMILFSPCVFDFDFTNNLIFKNVRNKNISSSISNRNVTTVALLKYLTSSMPHTTSSELITPEKIEELITKYGVPSGVMTWGFGVAGLTKREVRKGDRSPEAKNRTRAIRFSPTSFDFSDAWRKDLNIPMTKTISDTKLDDKIATVIKQLIVDQKFMTLSDIRDVMLDACNNPRSIKKEYIIAQSAVKEDRPIIEPPTHSTIIGK